jgi:hypothetical protein
MIRVVEKGKNYERNKKKRDKKKIDKFVEYYVPKKGAKSNKPKQPKPNRPLNVREIMQARMGAKGNPMMINTTGVNNNGYSSATTKAQVDKYIHDLLDPWNAQDARLPASCNQFSNCAQIKSDFTLNANVSGNLWMYFDPDFCANPTTVLTSFLYCNNAALSGNAPLTGAVYNTGPLSSVPVPPATTVLKTRLVSAAIKVTPKVAALTITGTIFACFDYGDYMPLTPNITGDSAYNANQQSYTLFSNILDGNGGKKFDIGIGKGQSSSVYMTWYPVDPISAVFVDAGDFVVDSGGDEAGGDPKFVLALSGFPSTAACDVQIIWNIEYLASTIAKPWLGVGGQGIYKSDALGTDKVFNGQAKNKIADRPPNKEGVAQSA